MAGVRFYPSLHPQSRQVSKWRKSETKTLRGGSLLSVVLEPGDVLFMPSYVLHHTEVPPGPHASISQNVWWAGNPELWRTNYASPAEQLVERIRQVFKEEKLSSAQFHVMLFATTHWYIEGCLGGKFSKTLPAAPNLVSELAGELLEESYGRMVPTGDVSPSRVRI